MLVNHLVFVLVGAFLFAEGVEKSAISDSVLCRMLENERISSYAEDPSAVIAGTRIVAVGDIHGAYEELLLILRGAEIIADAPTGFDDTCQWIPQPPGGTTLIQMGDVVDRGPGATEAWNCLDMLQRSAPAGSEVIRLVGNHELWWLEGLYHDRNKKTDSLEKCKAITNKLRQGISNESIIGSYVRDMEGVPLMFVHAGFRKEMIDFMKKKYSITGTANELSYYTNKVLKDVIVKQSEASVISLPRGPDDELFEAGPERGGRRIGGPYWTDFRVLQQEGLSGHSEAPFSMMQIVGHTAKRGSFRGSEGMSALCIDTAMYTGMSTYLEIGYDKHFRIYMWKNDHWQTQDVSGSCQ